MEDVKSIIHDKQKNWSRKSIIKLNDSLHPSRDLESYSNHGFLENWCLLNQLIFDTQGALISCISQNE